MELAHSEDLSVSQARAKPHWRLPLSWRALVLLAALAGALVLTWFRYKELSTSWQKQMEEEKLSGLPDEVRAMAITDPFKVHIMAIKTDKDWVWRWGIFLPAGRGYVLKGATSLIPASGFPKAEFDTGYPDRTFQGLLMLEANIVRNAAGGAELQVRDHKREKMGHSDTAWTRALAGARSFECSQAGVDQMEVLPPEDQNVLLRWRMMQQSSAGKWQNDPNPCPGLMIWVEPEPKEEMPAGATKP